MNIFKKQKQEHVIIVGCSQFGSNIANQLSDENKSVTIIDIDENSFTKLSPSFSGYTVIGNGTEIDILEFSGVKNADILIASTNNDDTNIMIAQIAKQFFQIETVITRIYDSSKEISYADMNIKSICPSVLSANEFKRVVSDKEIN